MSNNSLRETFYNTDPDDRMIHKWDHYFEVYEKYFASYRNKPIRFLEIGIMHGGSLNLWKRYFGDQIQIEAVDINPECKQFEEENIRIHIGSQEDPEFLMNLSKCLPELDIILDDGGHTMKQQILTFNHLFPRLKEGGIYLVEDTHTSYWNIYGGGLNKKSSFIEYSKRLVDSIHLHHLQAPEKVLRNPVTDHIQSICFYDSIVAFEKKQRHKPFHTQVGKPTVNPIEIKEGKIAGTFRKLLGLANQTFGENFKKTR